MKNKELELLLSMHGEGIKDIDIGFETVEGTPLIFQVEFNLTDGRTIILAGVPMSVAYIRVSEGDYDTQP